MIVSMKSGTGGVGLTLKGGGEGVIGNAVGKSWSKS